MRRSLASGSGKIKIGAMIAIEYLPCDRQIANAVSHLIFSTTYEINIISLILQEKQQIGEGNTPSGRSRDLHPRSPAEDMCIACHFMPPVL